MLAVKWKDRKEIFTLSTLHSFPVQQPAVGASDNMNSGDEDNIGDGGIVNRRVRQGGQWRQVRVRCPQLVKDYKFMGGVDLHDQMTCVSKAKRQMRWYMRMFIKLILMCVYNAFVIEGHYQPHQIPGHRKRDLLSFKDANSNKRRRSSNDYPQRMFGVGEHIVCRGTGNDHRCAVCLKKQQEFLRGNRGVSKKDCPFKDRKTTFKCLKCNVYLCIGKEALQLFL